MQIKINHLKKSIIINNKLEELGDSFSDNIVGQDTRPVGTRYLATITRQKTGCFKIVWGWSDDDIKERDPPYLQEELKKINFSNNLESLLDYKTGVTAHISFIFSCLECIRKHYNKPIYFVDKQSPRDMLTSMIFI